jgi:hypothetical protein
MSRGPSGTRIPALPPRLLAASCETYLEEAMDDARVRERFLSVRVMRASPKVREEWRRRFLSEFQREVTVPTRDEQRIRLRRLLIAHDERLLRSALLLGSTLSREARAAILSGLHAGLSLEEAKRWHQDEVVFGETSVLCIRYIAGKFFADAAGDDFFPSYRDLYKLYVERSYESLLARAFDEGAPLAPLVVYLERLTEEAKGRILAGDQWRGDTQGYDRETRPRPVPSDAT